MIERKGKLIILTGPSGAGKDTVMFELMNLYHMSRIVTYASRPPRPGEADGIDYHFVSEKTFQQMITADDFLEFEPYSGFHRGTAKEDVLKPIIEGVNTIWRIDAKGAWKAPQTIKNKFDQDTAEQLLARTMIIYLGASSLLNLVRRQARRTGSYKDEIVKRVREDWGEWKNNGLKFKNVVINREDCLDQTLVEVMRIIANGA